ncbi:MAG: peptidylprolyl isomerase [Phycisphaerales bacterium]
MQPLLAEAAGAEVLQEITLDRALAEEARLRNVVITEEQVRAEEANLLRTLREAGAALDDAGGRQVLDDLRRRRGLGPRRYEALLRRTALLRAMVQDRVDLTDAALRRAFELIHGPRYRVRIITVDSIPAADAVQARLGAGESFGEVAARFSTDPSAGVGGLVEPISAADLNYPSALREALPRLQIGRVGGPIAIERGYVIVRLDEVLPADGVTFEEARDAVEREARIAQERTLMGELAARLIGQSGVTALDPSLDWSWRQQR